MYMNLFKNFSFGAEVKKRLSILSYPPGCVGDPHMTNVSPHQLRREGVFGDEEDGTSQIYVQTDTSLTLRSVFLQTGTHGTKMYKKVY